MFPPYLRAQDKEAYGFEFQDNKVPKYLTEENGVAEVRMQVQGKGILIKAYSFTFDLIDHSTIFCMCMAKSQVVKME